MKGTGEGKLMRQIYSSPKISAIMSVVLLSGTLIISSCTKIGEFNIGANFFDSKTNLAAVDTFTAKVSTATLDTVLMASLSSKVALVGTYNDKYLGYVNSEAYFDLAYESFTKPDSHSVFDSAAFDLVYSKYYYGDTTALMTINIHQLKEQIAPVTGGSLYNITHFDYSPESLGTLKFYPNPTSSDSTMRLHVDAFGEDLFNKLINNEDEIRSEEWFADYIKGFVLVSDSSQSNVVLGFKADDSHLILKIYYHTDTGEAEKQELDIKMGSTEHQFNHVKNNLTGAPLEAIKANDGVLSSDKSDNKAFLQGLFGYVPKIQFPTLEDLLMSGQMKILKAELIIEPEIDSYEIVDLPSNIVLYTSNLAYNNLTQVKNDNGYQVTGTLTKDKVYRDLTNYTFDITHFINSQITNGYFDSRVGILLCLSSDKLRSTLDRLVLDCTNSHVKLRVYYLSY